MKPNIGISNENLDSAAGILNRLLSDEVVLYVKTLNYHWNVSGPHFHDLHDFFGEQYSALAAISDEVAERAKSLGGRAYGTLSEFKENTRLSEQPAEIPAAPIMAKNLLTDHEAIIRQLRTDVETCSKTLGDEGTADFLTGLMEKHEKMAWMLRSLLEE